LGVRLKNINNNCCANKLNLVTVPQTLIINKMKNIFKALSLTVLLGGLLNYTNAQRSRNPSGHGNTSASRSVSRASSAPRQMQTRSAPARSFNNTRSFNNNSSSASRAQRQQPTREMTSRQRPERNFNTDRNVTARNLQNSSNTQRVSQSVNRNPSERLIVSRNNNNTVSRNNYYDRNRSVSRNGYRNNYRYDRHNYRYGYNYHYYGYVYGRRTRFIYGPRYRVIPHNFISIHFGGYPYYYYGGCFYGYYGGYYQPLFPPFGLRISVLPVGYASLFLGGIPYYYYNGIYYRQYDNSYKVVDAPMGAVVSSLPDGARSVVINGEKLYELNGTYYKADRDEKGNDVFVVVGKNGVVNNTPIDDNSMMAPSSSLQTGDTLSELPADSKIVTINGEEMYKTPDNVYLRKENKNGAILYEVVGQ
jgi:hypothetical protein